MDKVGVGIIGSQFVAEIHAEALKRVPDAEIVAAASPTEEHVKAFTEKHSIPHRFTDYREMLALPEVDMVTIGAPNDLHCRMVVDAAAAGKQIVCEKPLCRTMEEADRMVEACHEAGVKFMYAEELLFVPKYVRAKDLIDAGAIGDVFLVKQCEKHDGPHSDWFWDVERSGGGVTLDMGCHAFQFFRWIYGNRPVVAVTAQMGTYVHADRTKGDDDAIIIVEFEGGPRGMAEESWAKPGGMDDAAEFYGSKGVIFADLLYGNAMRTYSQAGYDYAVEKAESTVGWSFTTFEEMWNYGFPQEFADFVDCVKNDREPLVTGDDGRAVMEIIFAAYESAGTGKRVELPFSPPENAIPIDLWKPQISPGVGDAQDLADSYMRELRDWFVAAHCPYTGQRQGSAGGAVTCAWHVVLRSGVDMQGARDVVADLLELTAGKEPGCLGAGQNAYNAARFWDPRGNMALVHGYSAGKRGLQRHGVHPVMLGVIEGPVYHPHQHPRGRELSEAQVARMLEKHINEPIGRSGERKRYGDPCQ